MTEHTPGPWEAAALGTIIRTKTGVNERGGMTGGVLVAQFFGAGRPAEADVNLMVAAPDMLAALKLLDVWFSPAGSSINARWERIPPVDRLAIVNATRAAISKAEGR